MLCDPNEKILYYISIMNKVIVNKDKVIKSVAIMHSDKTTIRSYLKGEVSKSALSKKGIILAKPL